MKADVKVRFLCLLIVGIAAAELTVHAIRVDMHDQSLDQRVALYPGDPPGEATYQGNLPTMEIDQRGRLKYVQEPVLDIYHAEGENRSGAAVVICPGGGYDVLTYDHEGTQVAKWLSKRGVTSIILRYRMNPYKHPVPMMDVQRAMQMVRANAKKWSIDPDRIGVMGFSAGGHLASVASVHHIDADPASDDPVLRVSSRPDFSVLVYPVITMREPLAHVGSREHLLGSEPSESVVDLLSTHLHVDSKTPQTLLVHSADDDHVPFEHSELYLAALKRNRVSSKFLAYDLGGHGYGLGRGYADSKAWPNECLDWLDEIGVLGTATSE